MKKLNEFLSTETLAVWQGILYDDALKVSVDALSEEAKKAFTGMYVSVDDTWQAIIPVETLTAENFKIVIDKNDNIKVTKKGNIKITNNGYFFDEIN